MAAVPKTRIHLQSKSIFFLIFHKILYWILRAKLLFSLCQKTTDKNLFYNFSVFLYRAPMTFSVNCHYNFLKFTVVPLLRIRLFFSFCKFVVVSRRFQLIHLKNTFLFIYEFIFVFYFVCVVFLSIRSLYSIDNTIAVCVITMLYPVYCSMFFLLYMCVFMNNMPVLNMHFPLIFFSIIFLKGVLNSLCV